MHLLKPVVLFALQQGDPGLAFRINEILAHEALRGALVSVTITDETGRELYSRNNSTRVVPASNQKILTCLFALGTFGPAFRPVTQFAKQGNRVFVDAPGDAELTANDVRTMGKYLQVKPGDRVLTRLAYNPGYAPSWEWDDLPNRYAPKITAFSVDEAGFEAKSRNGSVITLPRELGVKVIRRPDETGPKSEFDPAHGTLIVRGSLAAPEASIDTLAQPDPLRTASAYLGGKWSGHVKTFPDGLEWRGITGRPLSEVVKECLVDSDNHHAEHLLLQAARAEKPLEPRKEYSQAADLMRDYFKPILSEPSDFRPIDGSGLSRHNFVTTRGIAQILVWAQSQPWFTTFYDSLVSPSAGTLRSRNPGASFRGKTGTLNSVVSLSGYVKNAVGARRIVSVIFNHGTTSSTAQRDLADKLMRTVEEDSSSLLHHEALARVAHPLSANHANARVAAAHGDRVP